MSWKVSKFLIASPVIVWILIVNGVDLLRAIVFRTVSFACADSSIVSLPALSSEYVLWLPVFTACSSLCYSIAVAVSCSSAFGESEQLCTSHNVATAATAAINHFIYFTSQESTEQSWNNGFTVQTQTLVEPPKP